MHSSLVVAVSDNGVIGREQALPWHLPEDLKRFKKKTLGKPIIMGRRTWEAIGKPLPERKNIVVSRSPGFEVVGAVVVASIVEALAEAEDADEVCVIGGASLYDQLIDRADSLYLTRVHTELEGDTHFPLFEEGEWIKESSDEYPADEHHEFPMTFFCYRRKPVGKKEKKDRGKNEG